MTTQPQPVPDAPDGQELPAAFNPPPSKLADQIGRAIAAHDEALAQLLVTELPMRLAQLIVGAVQQIQQSQDRVSCWPCFQRKAQWAAANAEAIDFAIEQSRLAAEAATTPEEAAAAQDPMRYLPAALHLNPEDPWGQSGGMPAVLPVAIFIAGTGYCAIDAENIAVAQQPARPGQHAQSAQAEQPVQPAKRPLLVATGHAPIDTMAKAAAAATNVPGETAGMRGR